MYPREATNLPPLLRCGNPCGAKGERIAALEDEEIKFTYDFPSQTILEDILAKGPTFVWVSTGKNDKQDKNRVD